MSIRFVKSSYFDNRYTVFLDNKQDHDIDTGCREFGVNSSNTRGQVDTHILYEAYKQGIPLVLTNLLYSGFRGHHTIVEYEHYYNYKLDAKLSLVFNGNFRSQLSIGEYLYICYLYGLIDTCYQVNRKLDAEALTYSHYVPNENNWKEIVKQCTRYDILLAVMKFASIDEIVKVRGKKLNNLAVYKLYTEDKLLTKEQVLKYGGYIAIVACDLHKEHVFSDVSDEDIDYLISQGVTLDNIKSRKESVKYDFLVPKN